MNTTVKENLKIYTPKKIKYVFRGTPEELKKWLKDNQDKNTW